MKQTIRSFVGMDVHKATISISVAEDGRSGPVRFIGVIPNTPEAVTKMAKQLAKHGELEFCYEASGCEYGIHRQLTGLGHKCIVAAPSMIPRKPGERIKTDRRDSEKLAILHRSGDLTPVWVPDTTHEALQIKSFLCGDGLLFFNGHLILAAPFHRHSAIPRDCREVGRFLVLPVRPDHIRRGEFDHLTPSW
jgi:hypothetical protein